MPKNKAKQVAKPPVNLEEEPDWPDDESEDEDYGSDLESNGSYVSSDWEPITPDELRLLAADLRSKIEEQGGASGIKSTLPSSEPADKGARSKIIQDSVDRIERSWGEDTNFDREVVETLVCRYLFNKCRQVHKKFHFRTKEWTYRDILVDRHQAEIDKMAVDMSGELSGSVGYLTCYKKAMKVIEEGLDEETRVEYRAEAKKWAEQEAPPQQQQRMFAKRSIDTMQDFSETMYRQYGVRIAILGGYCDNDGPSIMFYDNNDKLGRTSFKAWYKGWLHDPMVKEFSRWTAESFGDHPADSVLPNWETIDRGGLIYKKMVIGQFMSEMYRIAAGGGKRRVPWAKLHEAQGDWISAEYLPEGVTLTQYHHIRLDDANSLLKHWILVCGPVRGKGTRPHG
ncbi:hypothetical protein EDB89DRAFT_2075607 [Lactarius sanguifluus]|nr:hypothetical protein EDB89DRAFT_2075607 [Lactarius sanguifluus]